MLSSVHFWDMLLMKMTPSLTWEIQAIKKVPAPSTVSELKLLLGLINYCNKFLPSYLFSSHPYTGYSRKVPIGYDQQNRRRHLKGQRDAPVFVIITSFWITERSHIIDWSTTHHSGQHYILNILNFTSDIYSLFSLISIQNGYIPVTKNVFLLLVKLATCLDRLIVLS